ncbi:MAG: hypothetical protein IJW28_00085 [Clostridia bacterium]|nr:hypothetical protein [Clostridia bacterium]
MPSIASHFVVAKKVSTMLNIDSLDYYIGSILPDVIDDPNSHLKIKGTHYLIPDIDTFVRESTLDEDMFIGYLVHLLLDKYFLEHYIIDNVPDYDKFNLFTKDKIYEDYTRLNGVLLKEYDIAPSFIENVLDSITKPTNTDKFTKNRAFVSKVDSLDSPIYINISSYKSFVENVSYKIYEDVLKILNHKNLKN